MTGPHVEPDLVPELLVTDVAKSIEFWCGLLGFEISYDRPDEGFTYVTRGSTQVMLEQCGVGRNWLTDELETPFGRGINFQIGVRILRRSSLRSPMRRGRRSCSRRRRGIA